MFWAAVFAVTFFHCLAAVAAIEFIDYPPLVTPGETYRIGFNRSDDRVSITVGFNDGSLLMPYLTITLYLVEGPPTGVVVVAEIGRTNNHSEFFWTVAKDLKPADDYFLKIVQSEKLNYSGPVSIKAPTNTTTTALRPTSSTPSTSTSTSAANTPTTNNNSSSQSTTKLAIGLGAGLGVSVLIIALVVVGLLLRRHKKAEKKEGTPSEKFAYYGGKPEIDSTAIEKEGFVYELNGESEKRELHSEARCLELETQHTELESLECTEMEGDF